jgi:hypothetical protein
MKTISESTSDFLSHPAYYPEFDIIAADYSAEKIPQSERNHLIDYLTYHFLSDNRDSIFNGQPSFDFFTVYHTALTESVINSRFGIIPADYLTKNNLLREKIANYLTENHAFLLTHITETITNRGIETFLTVNDAGEFILFDLLLNFAYHIE